ncbi:MAG TPA: hypothetical protein VF063_10585 [Gaiellaceae bacterium]
MTKTARSWYSAAAAGLRPDQAAELLAVASAVSDARRAPRIGGNHVLKALISTDLYQRSWPSVFSSL